MKAINSTKDTVKSKLKYAFIAVLSLSFLLLNNAKAGAEKMAHTTKKSDQAVIIITSSENPWHGIANSHAEEEANMNIRAVKLPSQGFSTYPHLKKYDTENGPLIARRESPKTVVLNSRYFSDCRRTDATRPMAEKTEIGLALPSALKAFKAPKIALFLLDSQIIITYWHLEARLILKKESESPELYSAVFSGYHSYCTNDCDKAPLNFTITIEKKTGRMFLGWAGPE
jgi:hypothetical protein